jgi:hypothetical protein
VLADEEIAGAADFIVLKGGWKRSNPASDYLFAEDGIKQAAINEQGCRLTALAHVYYPRDLLD